MSSKKKSRQASPAVEQMLQQAIGLYQAGDAVGARTFGRKALSLASNHPQALHLLGVIDLDEGKADAAVPLLQQAMQADRDDPFVRIDLARAYQSLRRYADAEQVLTPAVLRAPKHPAIAFAQGALLDAQERHAEAEAAYRRALTLDPRFVAAWIALGTVQSRQKAYTEAEASYRRALQIDPRQRQAQTNLANVLREQGRIADAEMCYRARLAAEPNDAMTHYNLGLLLHADDRPDAAVACFEAAMVLDPKFAEAHFNFAALRADQGHLDEAVDLFKKLVHSAPDYHDAWVYLGYALLEAERYDEALECFQAFAQHAPGSADAHSGLGTMMLKRARMDEAETQFRAAVAASPGDFDFDLNLIDCLYLRGKASEAAARVAQLLTEHDPVETHRALGRRHRQRARYALAQEHYKILLSLAGAEEAVPEIARLALTLGPVDADAWKGFARFSNKARNEPDAPLPEPLAADLRGQTVVLRAEQGIGDELFFLRFAAEVAARGARVTYLASPKIASLLKPREAAAMHVVGPDEPLATANRTLWLTALPYALRAGPAGTPESFPGAILLRPRQEHLERIDALIKTLGPPPYVGVTWRGGVGKNRLALLRKGIGSLSKKIRPEDLGAALKGIDATVLVLQRNPELGEVERFSHALGARAHDLSALNDELEDMLALLERIDEYVGVSNTNMHLMAGLGKSARVLVPCPPEWRWMAEVERSAWFPEFPLYREGPTGDWSDALALLAEHLRLRFGARQPAQSSEAVVASTQTPAPHVRPASETLPPPAATVTRTAPAQAVISDDYRRMQEELHRNPNYGVASVEFAPTVAHFIQTQHIREMLDYGAGKGRLGQELRKLVPTPLTIRHYEPAVEAWSAPAEPAEFVACIDVLEHIEPDLLDNVLDDLRRVVKRCGMFTIATGPARRILPDGRNAHLIQQPPNWWLPKLMQRFDLVLFNRVPRGFLVVVEHAASTQTSPPAPATPPETHAS